MNAPLKSTKNTQAGCALAFGVIWTLFSIAITIPMAHASPLTSLVGLLFVSIGIGITWSGVKPILAAQKIGAAAVVLSSEAPRIGEQFLVDYTQTTKSSVSVLDHTITLIFRESATYTRGTDTTTVTDDITVNQISYGPMTLRPGEVNQRRWEIQIPPNAMHSFEGRKNALRWVLQTKIQMAGWPAYEEEFVFTVAPVSMS